MAKRSRKIKKPYWQTEPCPAWCMAAQPGSIGHSKSDSGEDRNHLSRWESRIKLTTMDTIRHAFSDKTYYTAPKVVVYLNQGYRETAPRVIVEDSNGRFNVDLTAGEAETLARALLQGVRLAGGDR